jgi:hypothetical protein
MRVLKLDRHRADAALREIGFNIEEGGVAKIAGDMTIRATRPSDSDSLLLEIKLPNGHLLDCKTSCAVLAANRRLTRRASSSRDQLLLGCVVVASATQGAFHEPA